MHLPTGLQIIDAEAFTGLTFQAVIIPDSCTAIGSQAFAGCTKLVYVYIPASVTTIDAGAFDGCPNVIIDRLY
ncbi:MAG: leucine-rich repeat protein [Clostridia bacterium]|nr:leucine-rich repeat protein [Clostridia bacterium]